MDQLVPTGKKVQDIVAKEVDKQLGAEKQKLDHRVRGVKGNQTVLESVKVFK